MADPTPIMDKVFDRWIRYCSLQNPCLAQMPCGRIGRPDRWSAGPRIPYRLPAHRR